MKNSKNYSTWISLVALAFALASGLLAYWLAKGGKKVAFVDSSQLMTSFKVAHLAETQLQEEDKKWKSDQKILQDSLDAYMLKMTSEYEKANPKRRRELQDELSAKNQQIGNFKRANENNQQKLRQEKMTGIYSKINAFMKEFGAKNGYDIIFGTVQGGNILYGIGTRSDITQEVIDGLNKRYP